MRGSGLLLGLMVLILLIALAGGVATCSAYRAYLIDAGERGDVPQNPFFDVIAPLLGGSLVLLILGGVGWFLMYLLSESLETQVADTVPYSDVKSVSLMSAADHNDAVAAQLSHRPEKKGVKIVLGSGSLEIRSEGEVAWLREVIKGIPALRGRWEGPA